jgi:anti-anti-sigma factor
VEFSETTAGQTTIVAIQGRIHIPAGKKLKKLLLHLVKTQRHHIIVNCKGVETLSREGVRALIAAQQKAKNHGGELVLACLSAHTQEVLLVSEAISLFHVFPDVASAENYFSSPFLENRP